jgi:arginine decarboxylase
MKNRIPKKFFITKGKGNADMEIHAGSYHVALFDAGICNYNIQTYSSVLPRDAKEYGKDESVFMPPFGSELYTIMSCKHGEKGERISAGIIFADLIAMNGDKQGGLVCEVCGNYDRKELKERLNKVIKQLYDLTYREDEYTLCNYRVMTETMIVEKEYGTVLVALCFTDFD